MIYVLAVLLVYLLMALGLAGCITSSLSRQVITLQRQLDDERRHGAEADVVLHRRNALLGLEPFSRN